MKKLVSLLIICCSFFGYGQNFKGEISAVKKSGLHQITIDPNIRAFAKDDLRFLRIVDQKNNQVPYAFAKEKQQNESYEPFTIISKNSIPDSITSIVIQNEKNAKISQFSLQIENTSLKKSYSISGSPDGKEWFGLVADEILTDMVAEKGTSVSKTISFPANTYTYLRVIFNDKKALPLNIISVGIAETLIIPESFVEISDFKYQITEDKKWKVTKIAFSAENRHQIDAISFAIQTEYFNRNAIISVKRQQNSNKRVRIYDETLEFFELNSKKNNRIYFSALNEKEFTVEIENQDNQPLLISKIQVLQKPLFIVSKLVEGEKYRIITDTTLSKPTYDLQEFVADSVANFPEVSILNFTKQNTQTKVSAEKKFWQTPLFMWMCILFGGGIVAYFAFGLLKDMRE